MNPLFNNNSENSTNYVIPDMSLRYKLRVLMTQYSGEEIHATLQQMFQDDYSFYQRLFAVDAAPSVTVVPSVVVPTVSNVPPTTARPNPNPNPNPNPIVVAPQEPDAPISNSSKIRADTRIRIVKRPTLTGEEVQAESQAVVVSVITEKKEDEEASVFSSPDREKKAQIKREQTEKEQAKYRELQAKGIDPENLLTKENLKKWIETDNLSYAQIARDHVGLSAMQVSTVAKGFGFKSMITKKRAMLVAAMKK